MAAVVIVITMIAIPVIYKCVIVVQCRGHSNDGLVNKLNLKEITDRTFRYHKVYKGCSLREAVKHQLDVEFKEGHAFCEFLHEEEEITEENEIIFWHKVIMYIILIFIMCIFNHIASTVLICHTYLAGNRKVLHSRC